MWGLAPVASSGSPVVRGHWYGLQPGQARCPGVPLTVGRGPGCPPFPGGWGPPCSALCAPPTAPWLVKCPRQLPFSQDVGPPPVEGRREGNESVSRRRWNSAPAFISSLPGRRPWNPKCCDTPERGDIAAWDQHPHAGRSATSDSLIPKSWICVPLREDVLT